MFILIGEAYRKIEVDHNPLLREARKNAADNYESGPSNNNTNFKSRRPENQDFKGFYDTEGNNTHQQQAYDWNEEKFLRRYRYSHLRSDSTVPMSIRNIDRHGLGNLKKEATKPLDRVKIPPFVLYVLGFGGLIYILMVIEDNKELNLQNLQRRNTLLAMKKTQQQLEYQEEEITPVEEITMASKQYQEVVEKRSKSDKQKLDSIKSLLLMEGKTSTKKVDLRD